jgi:GNAT superfamily N-acetyltransferase
MPDDAPKVRLPLSSRFNAKSLGEHAARYPNMVFTASGGREFAVTGPWRHRSDIVELIELSSGPASTELLARLAETLAAAGVRLIVLDYGLAASNPTFFERSGFVQVERIVEYERPKLPVSRRPLPSGFVVRPYRAEDRAAVLSVERASFPWLWWNSEEEWGTYLWSKGVEVFVGWDGASIVGYAGFVVYRRDGHLDRLAVRESDQGRGFGAALLVEAIARMSDRGATRIALTTQENNFRSQRLYEQNGFRRARWTYEIHGLWLGQSEETHA